MLTLAHFLETLIPQYEATGQEPAISSVVMDSREAEPGSLFVAVQGEHVDGHDFVTEAFVRGAIAALVGRPLVGNHTTIDFRDGQPLPFPLPWPLSCPLPYPLPLPWGSCSQRPGW